MNSLALPTAFRHRHFTLFWCGAVLSGVGSQVTVVAMAWQMYELTDSPLQIGLLGLGRALPQIGLALVGGVLADRFDRRRLMMLIQAGQFAVSVLLTVLTFTGAITPAVLFTAAVLLAFGAAIENPPRQAIVPSLLPAADLASGIALNTTQRSVSTILGPALAGLVLAVAGAGTCYLLDAASWLIMLGALALIRTRTAQQRIASMSFEALLAGVRFLRGQRIIFSFMVLDFGATFFGAPSALFPIFARDIFEVGPVGLGLMFAAPSIGAVVTGVFMSARPQIGDTGRWVIIGVAFFGICLVLFAVAPFFWLAMVMLAGSGAGNTVSGVLRGTTNQLLTPDHLRGRVSAINSAFVIGGPQLGQFRSGVFGDLWGAVAAAALGGLGALGCAIAIGLVPGVWQFRLRPATEEPAAVQPPAGSGGTSETSQADGRKASQQ